MRAIAVPVAVIYGLLVLNFYTQSNGFKDHHTFHYAFWKITPVAFLSAFAYFHGAGLNANDRKNAALGLIFGGIGDWILGIRKDGIIFGAVAFAIGHWCYLTIIIQHHTKVHNRLVIAMLVWAAIIGQLCLLPLLPDHKLPVTIFALYSLLLSCVTAISISQYLNGSKTQNKEGLFYRAVGFGLFFISDSVLIMSHTGVWKIFSDFIILGTYYAAQFLILFGTSLAVGQQKSIKNN